MTFSFVKTLLSLLLFGTILQTHAQCELNGTIQDGDHQVSLGYALVTVGNDSMIADEKGNFSTMVNEFPTKISVQHIGYQTFLTKVMDCKQLNIAMTPSTLSLNEVVVLSSRKAKSTASSVDVVSPAMIQRSDPFQITSTLNRIPGIQMQSGTYTTNRIVMRGIGSRTLFGTNKIKAYYDEIPLTDGSGNSTIEDIDQSLIGRIEVIKGPNSSIYGAGLGGAIRLFSPISEQKITSLSTGFSVGAFETYRSSATLAHNNDKLSFRVSYSLLESAGYRENNETKREQIGTSVSYQIGQKHTLSLLAVGTKLFAQIPSALNETDFNDNPQKAAANWALIKGYEDYDRFILGLTHRAQIREKATLSTTLFVNTKDSYEPRPFNTLMENTSAVGIRSVFTNSWKNITTTIGYEAFHDRNDWKIYQHRYDSVGTLQNAEVIPLQYKERRTYINAFTDNTISLSEKASVSFGLNINDTWYKFTDSSNPIATTESDYTFGVIISPKIGGTYKLSPSQILFTNISHGFSPPSLEETLYPDGQINPNIKPESGWNFEGGLRGNSRHLNYNLTAFYMLISDLLVAQRTAEDTYFGVNAGRNNHFGVEASGNYFFALTPVYSLNIFGAVSYSDFLFGEFENEGVNYDGNALTGVAKWNGNLGVELLSTSGFYGNITSRYMDKIPMNDANTKYTRVYFILDTKVGYRLEVGRLLLDGYLGLNNLTDAHYASMILINATGFGAAQPRYYYPGNPRNLFAGIQLKVRLGK